MTRSRLRPLTTRAAPATSPTAAKLRGSGARSTAPVPPHGRTRRRGPTRQPVVATCHQRLGQSSDKLGPFRAEKLTRPRPAPASASPIRRARRPVPAVPRRASPPSRSPWRCRRSARAASSRCSAILSSCRSIRWSSFFAARASAARPRRRLPATPSHGGGRGGAAAASSHPLAALQVLVDTARQHPQRGVAEQREHPVRGPLDEEPVVGDHDHRTRPAVEEVLQLGQGLDVEVVGGLVEEEHVRLVHQQPQDLQPAPLTAGQVADRRPLLLLGEAELLAELARGHLPALAEVDPLAAPAARPPAPAGSGRARPTSWER